MVLLRDLAYSHWMNADPDMPASPSPSFLARRFLHQHRACLLALLLSCLAVTVRIPHLDWGLPDVEEEALPMKKALEMWGWDEGHLRLDPQTAGWPSLSFYVHLGAQKLDYAIGRTQGIYHDRYDYLIDFALDQRHLLILARLIGVLCAAGVVWIGTRLAFGLGGWPAAVLSGGLLALSPMLVRHAQLVTPDILMALFSGLAVAKILAVSEHGLRRDYVWAGVFLGLGIACKYTPILFALSLYLVHLRRLRAQGRGLRRGGLDDPSLGWAALSCLAAFLLTSPYTLADLSVLRRDFGFQMLHMSKGHFGQAHEGAAALYYLREVLWPGLSGGGFVLSGAGLALASWKLRGVWRSLAICVVTFYLGIALLNTHFERYMLPLLLPLSLGLAAWPPLLRRWIGEDRSSPRGAILLGIALVALVPAAWGTWRYHQQKGQQDTLQLARDWAMETLLPQDPALAMEAYTPQLPSDRSQQLIGRPFFARLSPLQRSRLMKRPLFRADAIPLSTVHVELSAYYYDLRHFLPYDYIVTSSSVRGRYQASPDQFPRQVAFYQDLERYGSLVKRFAPNPTRKGPEIRFYHLSLQDKARIVAEKGAPDPQDYRKYLDRLHAPQFAEFVSALAQRAREAKMWTLAAGELDVLVEISTSLGMTRAEWLELVEKAVYDYYQGGEYLKSLARSMMYLKNNPDSAQVWGYQGKTQEKLGAWQDALQSYQRCASAAAATQDQQQWYQWAQARIAELKARINGK
jgi:hypothetical protein